MVLVHHTLALMISQQRQASCFGCLSIKYELDADSRRSGDQSTDPVLAAQYLSSWTAVLLKGSNVKETTLDLTAKWKSCCQQLRECEELISLSKKKRVLKRQGEGFVGP
jgi:hypothetical protein